jgi:hypothetical protein
MHRAHCEWSKDSKKRLGGDLKNKNTILREDNFAIGLEKKCDKSFQDFVFCDLKFLKF